MTHNTHMSLFGVRKLGFYSLAYIIKLMGFLMPVVEVLLCICKRLVQITWSHDMICVKLIKRDMDHVFNQVLICLFFLVTNIYLIRIIGLYAVSTRYE